MTDITCFRDGDDDTDDEESKKFASKDKRFVIGRGLPDLGSL